MSEATATEAARYVIAGMIYEEITDSEELLGRSPTWADGPEYIAELKRIYLEVSGKPWPN